MNKPLHVIRFQLMYMLRPHCRVRDKSIEKIAENLKEAGIGGELEIEILARVIKACNSMAESKREELLGPCLDAVEFVIRGKRAMWSPSPSLENR